MLPLARYYCMMTRTSKISKLFQLSRLPVEYNNLAHGTQHRGFIMIRSGLVQYSTEQGKEMQQTLSL